MAPPQPVPAVALPQPRLTGGGDEAFFPDEWGSTILASGLHEHALAGASKNGSVTAANPLVNAAIAVEPELNAGEVAKLPAAGTAGGPGPDETYWIFKPSNYQATTAKVSLIFNPSPGTYRRHGLRMFFDNSVDHVLINVPGVEKSDPIYGTVGRKDPWGVGINKAIIDQLFQSVGMGGVQWQIDVMAGYSTGFRGLNGTINNSVNPGNGSSMPGLLDLSQVTMVIYYDAFYIGDEHPPGECTWRALSTLDTATSNKVQVAVYDVTDGTPHQAKHLALHTKLRSLLNTGTPDRFAIIDIRSSTEAMYGLLFARMMDAAVKDGYFAASVLPSSLQNLMATLPSMPRGKCQSPIPSSFTRLGSSTGAITQLTTWGTTNAKDVAAFTMALRDQVRTGRVLPNNLMGWQPQRVDSMLHDGFIPEFGWELLGG